MNVAQMASLLAEPLHPEIPRVLPDGWTILQRFGDGGAYQFRNGLRVIVSTATMADGHEWMHISVSRKDRLPSYDDLKFVKNTFAEKRFAYQVFPPPDDNVNIHEFCLHLWLPLSIDLPIPNFGAGGSI